MVTSARLLKGALLGGMFGRIKPAPMPKAVDFRARTATDIALPAPLAGPAHPVEWAGEVRFGNHLGGLVNRMGGRKARFRALAADNGATQPDAPASPAEVAH